MQPGLQLDVGGGKNSTCLILLTEHPTGHQTVNLSVYTLYNWLHVPTRLYNVNASLSRKLFIPIKNQEQFPYIKPC
jgi:hypothetical protein